ncbi:MAG: aminomethyl-transferring glycine dehydrogenase subunit GcvPA [Spirochaetota bacterium]|nr:MAG: aminomethyl-transferring glycine dehydrogenase subunit GcvPA [Spirochaetota bacterium]
MRYIPNTEENIQRMLEEIGVDNIGDLFKTVPGKYLLDKELNLPSPLSELELMKHMKELNEKNASAADFNFFLGGGVYNHFIPSVMKYIVSRPEFYTSYTPYQPEVSQGTLQAMFEFQTLMCGLLGMDASNASLYDGASAAAESVLMALRINKQDRIAVSSTIHPDYRRVIRTYCDNGNTEIVDIPFDERGMTDLEKLKEALQKGLSCAVLQSPNFFGIVEDLREYEKLIHESNALLIVAFSEPIAFGLLRPPGDFEADICCGEGQSLGILPGFGGPHLGILTAKEAYVRNIPGRIVGRTRDEDGRDAYVLTLTAREQHIRREKARSNVCTNQGLCALMATVYLEGLGKSGIKKLAHINHKRAEYAKGKLREIGWIDLRFSSPTFNEFVLKLKHKPEEVLEKLLDRKIVAGLSLGRFYDDLKDSLLVSFTEMNTKEDIDNFTACLNELY